MFRWLVRESCNIIQLNIGNLLNKLSQNHTFFDYKLKIEILIWWTQMRGQRVPAHWRNQWRFVIFHYCYLLLMDLRLSFFPVTINNMKLTCSWWSNRFWYWICSSWFENTLKQGEQADAMLDTVQTRTHFHFLSCWTSLHGKYWSSTLTFFF